MLLVVQRSTIWACDAARGRRCSFLSDGTNANATPATAVTASKTGGKWLEVAQTSQMDDSEGVSSHLEAENSIQGWLKSGQ